VYDSRCGSEFLDDVPEVDVLVDIDPERLAIEHSGKPIHHLLRAPPQGQRSTSVRCGGALGSKSRDMNGIDLEAQLGADLEYPSGQY